MPHFSIRTTGFKNRLTVLIMTELGGTTATGNYNTAASSHAVAGMLDC